jgi:hypothetical protein
MADYYVYILYYDLEMTLPFYVGMGKGRRVHDHTLPKQRSGGGPRASALRETMQKIGFIPFHIVQRDLLRPAACALEKALIAAFSRLPDGPLVNLTDGGEGGVGRRPGWRHTPEAKAKMSAALRGRKQSPEHIAKRAAILSRIFKGKKRGPQSPETNAKRAASVALSYREGRHSRTGGMTGRRHSLETIAKMRATANRLGTMPPRHAVERSSDRRRGQRASAETRKKMSRSQLLRYSQMTAEERKAEKWRNKWPRL